MPRVERGASRVTSNAAGPFHGTAGITPSFGTTGDSTRQMRPVASPIRSGHTFKMLEPTECSTRELPAMTDRERARRILNQCRDVLVQRLVERVVENDSDLL